MQKTGNPAGDRLRGLCRPRTRFDKVHRIDTSPYHLVLLCKNEIGYQNLIAMVSKASVEGFYSKPRVDLELLQAHHEGLICLSACLAGQIPRRLMEKDYDAAKETALLYRIFSGRKITIWKSRTTAF